MAPGRNALNALSAPNVPNAPNALIVWVVRIVRNAESGAGLGLGRGFAGRLVVRERVRERDLGSAAGLGIGRSVAMAGLTARGRVGMDRVRVVADSVGRVGMRTGRGVVRRWMGRARTGLGAVGRRWERGKVARGVDVRWVPGRVGMDMAGACGAAGCGAAAEPWVG